MPDHPDFVFAPRPVVALAVRNDARRYPVRRVFCVGRNYAAHAIEMGGAPEREPPFYFSKSSTSLTPGPEVRYPSATEDLHHEVELVVALGRAARSVSPDRILDCVFGYAVGLDMTRRDLQRLAKERRRPWDLAKSFDDAGVISEIVPAAEIGHPARGKIRLSVGGRTRQKGDLSEMIWSVPEILEDLRRFHPLDAGDLIFTGTPSGVGAVRPGDVLHGEIEGVAELTAKIVENER